MATRKAADLPPATWKWPPLEPGETEAMREERIRATLIPLLRALAVADARRDFKADVAGPPAPQATGRVTFREADLARLIRAARKAGETVHRVELAPDGTLRIFLQPSGASTDAELDRELDAFERAQSSQAARSGKARGYL